jgi:hypothetical protein
VAVFTSASPWESCDASEILPQSQSTAVCIKLVFVYCSDEEEEDDVATPKPPVEPEEEKTLKKDEENDSKGTLTYLRNFCFISVLLSSF